MIVLFVASGNAHKIGEIREVLGSSVVLFSPRDVPVKLEPAETGLTFAENAALKSVAWAQLLAARERPPEVGYVLADDSGLEVDALNGRPGVQSARFAAQDDGRAGNSSDGENNAKLIRLLENTPPGQRTARFRCVLALTPVLPGQSDAFLRAKTRWFEGACPGHLLARPQGEAGFGYDPLFVPHGLSQTFAELGESAKNRVSHRARALAALRQGLGLEE